MVALWLGSYLKERFPMQSSIDMGEILTWRVSFAIFRCLCSAKLPKVRILCSLSASFTTIILTYNVSPL